MSRPSSFGFCIDGQQLSSTELVNEHLGLVKTLTLRMRTGLPGHIDVDDLIHEGILGLFQAAEKFDDTKGWKFSTFAKPRILGAITDALRTLDWAPRTVRARKRKFEIARNELEATLKRGATRQELAEYMGISLRELNETVDRFQKSTIVSLDETLHSDPDEEPQTRADALIDEAIDFTRIIEHHELRRQLMDLVDLLPLQEQAVFCLSFIDGKIMKVIACDLGLSETRIQQLRASSIVHLRELCRNPDFQEDLALYGIVLDDIPVEPDGILSELEADVSNVA